MPGPRFTEAHGAQYCYDPHHRHHHGVSREHGCGWRIRKRGGGRGVDVDGTEERGAECHLASCSSALRCHIAVLCKRWQSSASRGSCVEEIQRYLPASLPIRVAWISRQNLVHFQLITLSLPKQLLRSWTMHGGWNMFLPSFV